MKFANPEYFYLFLLIPIIVLYLFKWKKGSYIRVSSTSYLFKGVKSTLKVKLRWFPSLLKIVGISLLIVALARPQSSKISTETETEGIDIIIALDISTSMLAQDFKPNRFKAAAEVAKKFIEGRKNDRIGFVVFAGESFTQCPLTNDYGILLGLIDKIKMGLIEDGTAIGTAILNSVNRLKDSKAKSKVIILLTDGENNKGVVDPETAADAAQALGIRMYTIGIGKKKAPYPVRDFFGREVIQEVEFKIDEKMLKEIAEMTKGKFFRAKNQNKLPEIYKEIDKLEKSKINTEYFERFSEEFNIFLFPGILFILLGILLNNTYFKREY